MLLSRACPADKQEQPAYGRRGVGGRKHPCKRTGTARGGHIARFRLLHQAEAIEICRLALVLLLPLYPSLAKPSHF